MGGKKEQKAIIAEATRALAEEVLCGRIGEADAAKHAREMVERAMSSKAG
jgi:diacylglycerol kinase family enzyme